MRAVIKSISDVPDSLLEQIYKNNYNTYRFMKPFNQKNIQILKEKVSISAQMIILHCLLHATQNKDLLKATTIELPMKRFNITNKKKFYDTLKELVEHGFMVKVAQSRYILNPVFICFMNNEQVAEWNQHQYKVAQKQFIDSQTLHMKRLAQKSQALGIIDEESTSE